MNVLFLSISSIRHMSDHSISLDLLREFQRNGHRVYVMCGREKNEDLETSFEDEEGFSVLRVKIGNNKKAGLIEKGLTTIRLPQIYIKAIKKYLSDVKFDIVLYPTPPITHFKTVAYIKKRDHAKCYLLLKDIFPQNSVDLGMLSKSGGKGVLYKYFRKTEKKLYKISDSIGCMSQANVDYILKHNPEINPEKVAICPNSIEFFDQRITDDEKNAIRKKYELPLDKKVFVYGGNLGKPQGIPFLIDCLKKENENSKIQFLIVGDGTEYEKLRAYLEDSKQKNARLIKRLPKEEYDVLVAACDVGLIFLDYRFTIPNFPSRLLSYMQAGLPVLACTDPNTDIGKVVTEGRFGLWCESNNTDAFHNCIEKIVNADLKDMGSKGQTYLKEHYLVQDSYKRILKSLEK